MFNKIVFIGGVGRSGTSITRRLLGTHPEVLTFPFEYRFIIDPDGIIDFINSSSTSWSPYIADARIERLEKFLKQIGRIEPVAHVIGKVIRQSMVLKKRISPNSYHGWRLAEAFPNYYEHVQILLDRLRAFSFRGSWAGAKSFVRDPHVVYLPPYDRAELFKLFREFLLGLFTELQKTSGKPILVEDNTWNLLFAEELNELFPDSKFLHVYRDPRDNIASFRSQRWMPNDLEQCATIYRDLFQRIEASANKLPEGSYLALSIESIVRDTPSMLKKLDSHIGATLSPNLDTTLLSADSFGRWKRDISGEDLARIEPTIRGLTEKMGYAW